jgi:hypothetical protein
MGTHSLNDTICELKSPQLQTLFPSKGHEKNEKPALLIQLFLNRTNPSSHARQWLFSWDLQLLIVVFKTQALLMGM